MRAAASSPFLAKRVSSAAPGPARPTAIGGDNFTLPRSAPTFNNDCFAHFYESQRLQAKAASKSHGMIARHRSAKQPSKSTISHSLGTLKKPSTASGSRLPPMLGASGRQKTLSSKLKAPVAEVQVISSLGASSEVLVSKPPSKLLGRSGWAAARGAQGNTQMQKILAVSREERAQQARIEHREAMDLAHAAWKDKRLQECETHLATAVKITPDCDVIHRFRSALRVRTGEYDLAREDAGKAVASAPANPQNHHLHAVSSLRTRHLPEAGTSYLTSMSRGMPGSSRATGYNGYLNTVSRHRDYYAELRPGYLKIGSFGLARTPSRSSIFDPNKTFDSGDIPEDTEVPDPPQLSLVKAETNSVSVQWFPDTSGEASTVTIYAYELQMAQHDVCWEGSDFFDDFRPFETVHKGGAHVTKTTVGGLRVDNKIILRIRAHSAGGGGEWNELVVSTLPPLTKQTDALPLPRKWLQVDIGDLVPLHVHEVGGDPKRFFLELASCFTPHVRTIRRLFQGWSRASMVGQKARTGELSRGQFTRFAKEVGLCAGGGPMCKRSGANLLSPNDIDRIFQRANIDTRATTSKPRRGNSDFSAEAVSQLATDALDDLQVDGNVEAEAGESELRAKLRPIFDQFDEDGSGSVSTEEVGKMAASLKLELTAKQIEELMVEADPDGSGEIDFEELVAVLLKQMKEGAGGSIAALFNVEAAEDDDGGSASMVLYEFIHALCRLAWECYPTPNAGIGTRMNALLERAVIPGSSHITENADPFEAELSSKRVQAITEYYSDDLLEVFKAYAAADMSITAQAHLETMSFAELCLLVKHADLVDSNLTVTRLTAIFAQVNAQATDDGEKDEDAEELSFAEFKQLVCRMANAKIPQSMRGGEPFEYTWQSFLAILFLPKMRKIVKDMKRGLLKKTL